MHQDTVSCPCNIGLTFKEQWLLYVLSILTWKTDLVVVADWAGLIFWRCWVQISTYTYHSDSGVSYFGLSLLSVSRIVPRQLQVPFVSHPTIWRSGNGAERWNLVLKNCQVIEAACSLLQLILTPLQNNCRHRTAFFRLPVCVVKSTDNILTLLFSVCTDINCSQMQLLALGVAIEDGRAGSQLP